MAAQQAEEQSEQDYDDDMPSRLAGDCERCQEPQPDLLTVVGGEAICDDCVGAEATATDDSDPATEPPL